MYRKYPGLHEAPGGSDRLSAAPVCGGGQDSPRHRGGLYRRPPPLGGYHQGSGGIYPAEGLQRRREPSGHDQGMTQGGAI